MEIIDLTQLIFPNYVHIIQTLERFNLFMGTKEDIRKTDTNNGYQKSAHDKCYNRKIDKASESRVKLD